MGLELSTELIVGFWNYGSRKRITWLGVVFGRGVERLEHMTGIDA